MTLDGIASPASAGEHEDHTSQEEATLLGTSPEAADAEPKPASAPTAAAPAAAAPTPPRGNNAAFHFKELMDQAVWYMDYEQVLQSGRKRRPVERFVPEASLAAVRPRMAAPKKPKAEKKRSRASGPAKTKTKPVVQPVATRGLPAGVAAVPSRPSTAPPSSSQSGSAHPAPKRSAKTPHARARSLSPLAVASPPPPASTQLPPYTKPTPDTSTERDAPGLYLFGTPVPKTLPEGAVYTLLADIVRGHIHRYNPCLFVPQEHQDREICLHTLFHTQFCERYLLRQPKDDELDPGLDIPESMQMVAVQYLSAPDRLEVLQKVVPAVEAAFAQANYHGVLAAVEQYNRIIDDSRDEIRSRLATTPPRLNSYFVHTFLQQLYARVVAPQCAKLSRYKPFSNFVYGELMPQFVTDVFRSVCDESSIVPATSSFVDLGSGVGNAVFQAAVEFGFQHLSGVEIMEHPLDMADAQLAEYKYKCQVYGLRPASITFYSRQLFLDNPAVAECVHLLRFILCNNYAFDFAANEGLVKVFGGCQAGTVIVLLKPLVPYGYRILLEDIDAGSILPRLLVKKVASRPGAVLWTGNPVYYYVNTVQTEFVQAYYDTAAHRRLKLDRRGESNDYGRPALWVG